MPIPLQLLGVLAIAGAPAPPGAAQPDAAAEIRAPEAIRLQPGPAARPAFPARTQPLRLVVRGDRKIPEVEVPLKDAWAEDEGFRLKAAKVAYVRRF